MPRKSIPVWVKERMNEFQQAVGRPFSLERVARVTCDVGYLCANFRLPGPLCSRIGYDVYATDRQTSDTHDCLMPPTLMAGHNNASSKTSYHWYQKCVSPCGKTNFSPQGHLLRTRCRIRKKHWYHRYVCPCGETTYFLHKTILYARVSNKSWRKVFVWCGVHCPRPRNLSPL